LCFFFFLLVVVHFFRSIQHPTEGVHLRYRMGCRLSPRFGAPQDKTPSGPSLRHQIDCFDRDGTETIVPTPHHAC
jgi:hypothetical protein